MNSIYFDVLLKFSHEGREWFTLMLPLITGLIGWHVTPPSYMKKDV